MTQLSLFGPPELPPLMVEALKAWGIDADDVPPATLDLACERCQRCEDRDRCFAWLTGEMEPAEYRWFCPNATLFDDLRKRAA